MRKKNPSSGATRAYARFPFTKSTFLSFQKSENKNLGADNLVIYNPAKSHSKIRCIMGYTKKDKSGKISIFANYALFTDLDLHNFLYQAKITTNISFDTLHSCRSQYYLQLEFFAKFKKHKKCRFRFFQKQNNMELGLQNPTVKVPTSVSTLLSTSKD